MPFFVVGATKHSAPSGKQAKWTVEKNLATNTFNPGFPETGRDAPTNSIELASKPASITILQ